MSEPQNALTRHHFQGQLAPLYPERTDRLVYDGDCGLCHGAVNFVIKHDRRGTAFRFTPLASERVDQELPERVKREVLPDSMLVITEDRQVLTRSDAVLYIGMRLGGPWRLLATLASAVPRKLRDTVYDMVARVRHLLFAKPQEACPIAPPEIRARFDA